MSSNAAHDGGGASPARRPGQVARGKGREALCRALVRIVAREGFDAITFRSVAAEAGVTHGLASYHFRTREEMIHESLAWAVRDTLEASRLSAPIDDVARFAQEVSGFVAERPEESVFQFELLLRAVRSRSLLEEVRRSYDAYVEATRRSLESVGVEGEASAVLAFAALDGLTLQQLLYGDGRRFELGLGALRTLLALAASATAPELRAASG